MWSLLKSDWLCSLQLNMEKLSIVSKRIPEAGFGSYHELLTAKFRLKLEKTGKNNKVIQVWPKTNHLSLYSGEDEQIQGIRSGRKSTWRNMDGDL